MIRNAEDEEDAMFGGVSWGRHDLNSTNGSTPSPIPHLTINMIGLGRVHLLPVAGMV